MTAVAAVLKDLGITEQRAVREYAFLNASQKYAEFAQECESFERKFGASFTEFEKQLQTKSEESFEEDDNYLAWRFAVKGAAYWQKILEQMKSE